MHALRRYLFPWSMSLQFILLIDVSEWHTVHMAEETVS